MLTCMSETPRLHSTHRRPRWPPLLKWNPRAAGAEWCHRHTPFMRQKVTWIPDLPVLIHVTWPRIEYILRHVNIIRLYNRHQVLSLCGHLKQAQLHPPPPLTPTPTHTASYSQNWQSVCRNTLLLLMHSHKKRPLRPSCPSTELLVTIRVFFFSLQ